MPSKTEFAALTSQLSAANAKIVELEKQVATERNAKDTWYKSQQEANEVIEQVHQFLDAVPNSVKRESEGEYSWNRVKLSPVTRLAAWLAIRN